MESAGARPRSPPSKEDAVPGRPVVARLALLVPLLAGCVGKPAVLSVDDPAPARSPDSVELLLEAPDRPFRMVGIIRSAHFNPPLAPMEKLKEQVRREAAALGADAVIVTLGIQEGGGGDMTGMTLDGEVVIGAGSSGGATYVLGRAVIFTDG